MKQRFKREGPWNMPMTDQDYVDRYKRRCVTNEKGCWVWQGFCCPDWGYGLTSYRNKSVRLHRIMWQLTRGELQRGTVVRHKCDNPPCCNPEHLEIGTHRDNVHDRMRRGRDHKSNLTHCPKGHPYAGEHLQVDRKGYRHCKTCSRIKQRIAAGWPRELAETLPKQPYGYSPLRRGE